MDFLADEGFTTITARELQAWLLGSGELPQRPIVIDFDDHSLISFKTALPVMQERGQHGQYYGKAEYITNHINRYRLPTMNISYLLPFEDFQRLVLRTDPDYEYYPECRTMWPE